MSSRVCRAQRRWITLTGGIMMNYRRPERWNRMLLGMLVGLLITAAPAVGQATDPVGEPSVRTDNRGPGSLNSGSGSMNSGRRGGDDLRVAQAEDVRQEDRQQARREDRREDRRADRQADSRSNAGGEVRGLDRADQVAGEHGQQGRDNARAAQMERSTRPERVEQGQRPERPERPQRPERTERAGRN